MVILWFPGFLTSVCFTDLCYGLQMSEYGFQMDNNEDHVSLQQSVS